MIRNLTPKDYDLILELDRKVYPTTSPVTKDNLAVWYSNNPGFGRIWEEDGQIKGLYVAIPLKKESWYQLAYGRPITTTELLESDINQQHLYDKSTLEIGIHIYHIEKFTEQKGFYKEAFRDLGTNLRRLQQQNPKLKLVGLSALCVTPAGIGLFEKLGFRFIHTETPEMIYHKEGLIRLVTNSTEAETAVQEGYHFRNLCRKMTLSPEDSHKSEVWKYFFN
jgi:hypothetical protein